MERNYLMKDKINLIDGLTFAKIPKNDEKTLMKCAEVISIQEPWITLKISKTDSYNFLSSDIVTNFGLFREAELLGFISLQLNGVLTPFIRRIAILPDYQNKGYGRALMEETENMVKKNSQNIFLLVSSFNEGARKFYQRLGYTETGVIKDLLLPGYDEILMRKVLR